MRRAVPTAVALWSGTALACINDREVRLREQELQAAYGAAFPVETPYGLLAATVALVAGGLLLTWAWRRIRRAPHRTVRFLVIALCGTIVGLFTGVSASLLFARDRVALPAPHLVSLVPGGTALRLAMVDDVLHERYPRHGEAWYRERVRRVRAALAGAPPTVATFELMDDRAAALDRLGRPAEAVEVMRDKEARVRAVFAEPVARPLPAEPLDAYEELVAAATSQPDAERTWYRTWANLGTFLVHAHFAAAAAGDAEARARVHEGHALVRRAMRLNPGAHFGRERWQSVAIAHFMAAWDAPSRLTTYDLLGRAFADYPKRRPGARHGGRRRASDPGVAALLAGEPRLRDRFDFRNQIAKIESDEAWRDAVGEDAWTEVAFDEPTLGLLGMWMQGGGPNPHFAVALGGLMEQARQPFVAWSAYARAIDLAPDGPIAPLARARQAELEPVLGTTREALQRRFDAELARGRAYQDAYARYEAERIAAGADPDAPDFHDAFHAQHGAIASPPGVADWVFVETAARGVTGLVAFFGWFFFGAGVVGLGVALPLRRGA